MGKSDENPENSARYEFRVWGRNKKARKRLADLADEHETETINDCYVLTDEPGLNVKIRDRMLKIKECVEREQGFERWEATRYRSIDDAPAPFDELFDGLRRARQKFGKSFDLAKAVARLDRASEGRVVLVTKDRQRFRIGSMRAEVTDITLAHTGRVLRTLAIEGADLDELKQLRKKLGLKGSENVAVHVAIEAGL